MSSFKEDIIDYASACRQSAQDDDVDSTCMLETAKDLETFCSQPYPPLIGKRPVSEEEFSVFTYWMDGLDPGPVNDLLDAIEAAEIPHERKDAYHYSDEELYALFTQLPVDAQWHSYAASLTEFIENNCHHD